MTGLILYIYIAEVYGLAKPFNGKSTVETREGLIVSYTLIVALFAPMIYCLMPHKVSYEEQSISLINYNN